MSGTVVRGIRGATTAEHDEAEAILAATQELLQAIVERRGAWAGPASRS